MWKLPKTSTPARLPLGRSAQTLKLAADIRTTFQPSVRIFFSAARLSRMMSNGCVNAEIHARSTSES